MAEQVSGGSLSRRGFLDWLMAASGIAWLGSAFYPVLRYLRPLPRSAGGPVAVPADKMTELQGPQQYTVFRAADRRILVLKDPDGKLHALSAACTHEACTVQYLQAESVIWCACHNGRFAIDGRVISGPPPRPLPHYDVERTADGQVVVTPKPT